jgi:phosphate transport system protein
MQAGPSIGTRPSTLGEDATAMSHEHRRFSEELQDLTQHLLVMGGSAEERLRVAVRALVDRDHQALADIIAGDSRIDNLQIDIDERCFTLLALHQPVAVDLRTVVSVLKIGADLERVGDFAVNIGEAAQRYFRHPPVKPLIDLPKMADLALKMLHEALEAFVSNDVSLAQGVLRQDDWLDALKNQIFRELLTYMLGEPRTIAPGIELILISRHLERVGDHATNIAEDVIFIVEARDVRHRSDGSLALHDQTSPNRPPLERRKQSRTPPV